jgi:hypothetical protein
MSTDLRMHNFAVFGIALLLATLPRARQVDDASAHAAAQDPALVRSTLEA